MSFFDDMQSALTRGTAAAGRMASSTKSRAQLVDINLRRTKLMSQLGEALYPMVCANREAYPELEQLLASIADLDSQASLHQQQIEHNATAAAQANGIPSFNNESAVDPSLIGSCACPTCGAPVTPGDKFCMSCGQELTWE